jgi:hypothetical protein
MYCNLIFDIDDCIIESCQCPDPRGREVIQMPAAGFASPADAAGMLDAALDHLAGTEWASLGTAAHGQMLARLQRAQARLTAVNAAVLAAFTAQGGYEPDGSTAAGPRNEQMRFRL